MKRLQAVLLAAALLSAPVSAQEDEDSGYTLIGSVSEDALLSVHSTEAGSAVPLSWLLYLDATHRFSSGSTELTLVHRTSLQESLCSTTVYEAYILFRPIDTLDLYAGQKRLNIGTGFLVSPGDSFNPAVQFFDQKTGGRGLLFAWSPTSQTGVTGGLSAERAFLAREADPELITWSLQGNLLLDTVQLQAGLTWGPETTFNPTAGFSYDLAGFIVSGEAALEFLPRGSYVSAAGPVAYEAWSSPKPSAAAGIRYTAMSDNFDLTAAFEYLYAGQAWSEEETEAWKAFASPAKAALLPAGFRNRHNIVARLSASGWTKVSAAVTAVVNTVDGSALINSMLIFSPWETTDLLVTALTATGSAGTEREYLRGIDGLPSKMNLTLTARYHF